MQSFIALQIGCSLNKQTLFIYRTTNRIVMKLDINQLEYLKYLYKKIEIFIVIF